MKAESRLKSSAILKKGGASGFEKIIYARNRFSKEWEGGRVMERPLEHVNLHS